MMQDPEYLADVTRGDQPRGDAIDGAALEKLVKELAASTTPEIVTAYQKIRANR
jgi:hypothetical protein